MLEYDDKMIVYMHTLSFLKKMDLFHNIPLNYLVQVAKIVHIKTFLPNSVLFKEGDPGDSLYLIASGYVSEQKNGNEIARLGPGECVGEMGLLDRLSRSATVIAIDQVQILCIYSNDFDDILIDVPEIARNIINILVKRLRTITDEMINA